MILDLRVEPGIFDGDCRLGGEQLDQLYPCVCEDSVRQVVFHVHRGLETFPGDGHAEYRTGLQLHDVGVVDEAAFAPGVVQDHRIAAVKRLAEHAHGQA